jgi:hypothetical protein
MSGNNQPIQRSHPLIGQCIYCGTKGDLTDEHTVPYSLNGAIKLKKASCKKCAEITSSFERSFTRSTLEVARDVMQYNTRRRNRRQQTYPVEVKIKGEIKTVEMPVDAYAALVPALDLGFPTYLVEKYSLSGPQYRVGRKNNIGITVSRSPEKTKAFLEAIGAESIRIKTSFNAYEFARMLAKIAYCETVALCGLENIKEVYVLDFILRGEGDPWRYIGGIGEYPLVVQAENPETNPDIRAVSVINGELRAFIQLFVPLGGPQYIVVVGEATDSYREKLHNEGYDDA